jgi:hypothetical protein
VKTGEASASNAVILGDAGRGGTCYILKKADNGVTSP